MSLLSKAKKEALGVDTTRDSKRNLLAAVNRYVDLLGVALEQDAAFTFGSQLKAVKTACNMERRKYSGIKRVLNSCSTHGRGGFLTMEKYTAAIKCAESSALYFLRVLTNTPPSNRTHRNPVTGKRTSHITHVAMLDNSKTRGGSRRNEGEQNRMYACAQMYVIGTMILYFRGSIRNTDLLGMHWEDLVENPYPRNEGEFEFMWDCCATTKRQHIAGENVIAPKNEHVVLPTQLSRLLQMYRNVTAVFGGKHVAFFDTRKIGPDGSKRIPLSQAMLVCLWKSFCGQKKIARALKLWEILPYKFKKEERDNKKKAGNLNLKEFRSIGITSLYMEWSTRGSGPFGWIPRTAVAFFLEMLAFFCNTSVDILKRHYIRVPIDMGAQLDFHPSMVRISRVRSERQVKFGTSRIGQVPVRSAHVASVGSSGVTSSGAMASLSFEEEGEVEVEMSGAELAKKCSTCFVRRQARPGKCSLCVDCLVYLSREL